MTAQTTTPRLDDLLAEAARRHPDRPALAGQGALWTYAELERAVAGLAAELSAAGVHPGQRVGVYAPKTPATVIALYAALRAGAVTAPMDVADPPLRTARMLRNAGISLLLTTERFRSAARKATAGVRDAVPDGDRHIPAERAFGHGLAAIEV
ncbi:AMP-binding protein, partial [Streptomyces collinus]